MAYGILSPAKLINGVNEYTYTHDTSTYNLIIYRAWSIVPAVSTTRVSADKLFPPTFICPNNNVLARTNANYFDSNYVGKAFYGVQYVKAGNQFHLSKDGKVGIGVTSSIITEGLGEGLGGWFRYSPSLCIDSNNNAKIHWFSTQSGGSRITISQGMSKYKTILGGQHCLVHNSKPVFEANLAYSFEGATIANWNDLNNKWNHHNEVIGGSNSKERRRRTFLGHTRSNEFPMVVVKGDHDVGTGTKHGMDLKIASHLMADIGCDYAINMDGGSPTQIWNGNILKYPLSQEKMLVGSAICAY